MKIINHPRFIVSIYKIGKGGGFYWRPHIETHRRSMGDFKYWKDDTYEVAHHFVTTCVQVFLFWFIVGFEIPLEKLSSSKYVRYESTHFSQIDDAFNQPPHQ